MIEFIYLFVMFVYLCVCCAEVAPYKTIALRTRIDSMRIQKLSGGFWPRNFDFGEPKESESNSAASRGAAPEKIEQITTDVVCFLKAVRFTLQDLHLHAGLYE